MYRFFREKIVMRGVDRSCQVSIRGPLGDESFYLVDIPLKRREHTSYGSDYKFFILSMI